MLAQAKLEDAQTVQVGAQKVRYVRRKADDSAPGDLPIVILHGWGAHIEAVGPILAALDGACDLIALDLPGFGESDPPEQAWDVDAYARFMIHFLDELSVERAHLVGHSHGGRVSIALAADEADRVGRLLLIDSAGLRPKRGWRYRRRVAVAKLGRLIGKLGAPGRRLQERMRAKVASRDYLEASETMRGTFRALIAMDLTDRLPRVRASTLLVWGDRDEDTPLWMGRRMEELIPDAGLVVLEGAGHYSYADSPGQFRAVARRFLLEQPREVAGKGGAEEQPEGGAEKQPEGGAEKQPRADRGAVAAESEARPREGGSS
jgi:pimeloyl-ACP methyl ester carboxylesterase